MVDDSDDWVHWPVCVTLADADTREELEGATRHHFPLARLRRRDLMLQVARESVALEFVSDHAARGVVAVAVPYGATTRDKGATALTSWPFEVRRGEPITLHLRFGGTA